MAVERRLVWPLTDNSEKKTHMIFYELQGTDDWCDFWRIAEKIMTDVTFDEQQRKLWLMWLLTNSRENYDWCDFWRIAAKIMTDVTFDE